VDIRCFVIENNFSEDKIARYMKSKGYSLRATLEVDQVFMRDD
jgi:hypothetical protein